MMSGNGLEKIPYDYFSKATKLEYMTLSENMIIEIPDLCMVANSIVYVDLSKNRVARLKSLLMCEFPNLTKLCLNDNRIKELGLTCKIRLIYWPMIQFLGVCNNLLQNVPGMYCEQTETPVNASGTVYIQAGGNKLFCDKSLQWVTSLVADAYTTLYVTGHWYPVAVLDAESFVCTAPPWLANETLLSLDPAYLDSDLDLFNNVKAGSMNCECTAELVAVVISLYAHDEY